MWQKTSLTWPTSARDLANQAQGITQSVSQVNQQAIETLVSLTHDANFGRHSLSADAEKSLGLRAKLEALQVTGTVITVSPYQFEVGERLDSGGYLSPDRAIKTLVSKLRDLSDTYRPKGATYGIGVMLTAQTLGEFATNLQTVTQTLTLPDWCQVERQSRTLIDIDTEKYHQPLAVTQPRFKPKALLHAQPFNEFNTTQMAQLATLESLASDRTDVIGKLQALAVKRAEKLTQLLTSIMDLKGQVYSVALSGTVESMATALQNTAAPNNHQFTVASLILSDTPLTFWKELLCSP